MLQPATPCPLVPFVIGSVRRHSLAHLWRLYCDGPDIALRGDCVMNVPGTREVLRQHVRRVADTLGYGPVDPNEEVTEEAEHAGTLSD